MEGYGVVTVVPSNKIEKSDYAEKRCDKINNFLYGKKLLLIVIIVLVGLNVLQFRETHSIHNAVSTLFLNKDKEFQWAGITSVVGIFTFLSTYIVTLNKNKADLVSKSRIEWIQEVKKLVTNYCISCTAYMVNCEDVEKLKKKGCDTGEVHELADSNFLELEKHYYLLMLNFSDNADNKQIIKCIEDVRNYAMAINDELINTCGLSNIVVKNLVLVSRDYFKREWNRAKRGK